MQEILQNIIGTTSPEWVYGVLSIIWGTLIGILLFFPFITLLSPKTWRKR